MKDQFDYEELNVRYVYTNQKGESVRYGESVKLEDGFPSVIDAVATSAESFFRATGDLLGNEYLFVDKLTEDELEAVTDTLAALRGTAE